MVTWILEKEVFNNDCFENMVAYLEQQGMPHHLIRVKSHSHVVDGKMPKIEGPCVVYGSIACRDLAIREQWVPGVWNNDQFAETVLTEKLGIDFLNNNCIATTLAVAADASPWNLFFIKPNTGAKEFAGTNLSKDRFPVWYRRMVDTGYLSSNDLDVPVIISPLRALGCEWRTVIVEGKVSDFSCYRQNNKVHPERWAPTAVLEFAEAMAARCAPAPVFTLDVVETNDGLKVVELNSFNSSGLYCCDARNIIRDVTAHVERTYA